MTTDSESGEATSAPSRTQVQAVIILDRSGSMESCRDATISGFNEYIDSLRDSARENGLTTQITLTVFNHDSVTPLFREPLERLHRLDHHNYVPGGNTAMLDAVGRTLDRLIIDTQGRPDMAFMVCIMSDGYENASREYTYEAIAERIGRLTAEGNWTFTYLGSNQDLGEVADRLSISRGNMASYASSPIGTRAAWRRHSGSARQRMSEIRQGVSASSSFYGSDEVAEIPESAKESHERN